MSFLVGGVGCFAILHSLESRDETAQTCIHDSLKFFNAALITSV